MNYLDRLREKSQASGNILCMGIDPSIEKMPHIKDTETSISTFFLDILQALEGENILIPTVKPNIAFFEQYGFEGLRALKKIIEKYKGKGIDVILDAKRADIGKTSEAYAKSVFNFWNADAVTVNPYLGYDGISPFLDFEGKGTYVLNRTSNKSATEIQDLNADGSKVYMKVSELICKWHKPGLGAVVGATYSRELAEISSFYVNSGLSVPLLIPGLGSQGGSGKEVVETLEKTGNPLWMHRVNSSSGISYAYLKQDSSDYAGCAVNEIKKLAKELKV